MQAAISSWLDIVLSEEVHDDDVKTYSCHLTHLLLIRKLLTTAISYGDGETVYLVAKYMCPLFKASGNTKYALMCLEFAAQVELLLSERDKSLVLHERFCNFVGKEDTNYALDMNVEFSNRIFKNTLHVYKGEPTTEILERVSRAQDITIPVLNNYTSEFCNEAHYTATRKSNDELYSEDVKKLLGILIEPFEDKGRKLITTVKFPIVRPEPCDLHKWMRRNVGNMSRSKIYS